MKEKDINYIHYSWPDFDQDCDNFLNYFNKITHHKFELVVGVASGGLPLMTKLKNRLNLPYDIIKASSYKEKERGDLIVEIPDALKRDWEGRNVIITEDLIDTGHTLRYIIDIMKDYCNPYVISIFHKEDAIFTPDYSLRETKLNDWVNFPWD